MAPDDIQPYSELIKSDFPEFDVKSIKYLGSGWDNAAFLVNGEYVFRFLHDIFNKNNSLDTTLIEKEANVLKYLDGKLSFTVPKPDFVPPNYSYFGYKLVPGKLWDKLKHPFSDELLQSWVQVRTEISKAIPVEQALKLKAPYYHFDKNEDFVEQFINDPSANINVKRMVDEAADYVLSHLGDKAGWVFVHEDLQMSNALVDENQQKIVGVIDFGDSEISPVEADFYFWSKYGKEMLHKVADMQEAHDGTKIDPKLARCMHQFYIVADYQEYKSGGFNEAAAHKWHQIEAYL